MKTMRFWPLCLGFVALLAASCDKQKAKDGPEEEAAISVKTARVGSQTVVGRLTVSGDIEGWRTVKTGFMVAGRIEGYYFEEGQLVGRGALLARLDPTSYAIAKEMADVQVRQAQDEYKRLELMFERKSISESDFNKCRFALEGALAQQKLRKKELNDTRLTASIGGILLKKVAETGEIVSAGMPVAVVADISRVKVSAYVPENQLGEVHIGQKVSVSVEAIGRTAEGTVREVSGMADPQSRSFTVKVEVANPGLSIRPGMIAEVSIPTKSASSRMVVPSTAILHTPEGNAYVYVADEKRGQAFRRNVSVGIATGQGIEVLSGLKEGETLVVGGQQKLSNGSKIKIRNL